VRFPSSDVRQSQKDEIRHVRVADSASYRGSSHNAATEMLALIWCLGLGLEQQTVRHAHPE
jgi:hypothetical protein